VVPTLGGAVEELRRLRVDRVDGLARALPLRRGGVPGGTDAAVLRVHLALVGEGEPRLPLRALRVIGSARVLGHHFFSSSSSTISASTTSSSSDDCSAPAASSAPSAPSACEQIAVPTACSASFSESRLASSSSVEASSFASCSLDSLMASSALVRSPSEIFSSLSLSSFSPW